jgi:hypothetical protein
MARPVVAVAPGVYLSFCCELQQKDLKVTLIVLLVSGEAVWLVGGFGAVGGFATCLFSLMWRLVVQSVHLSREFPDLCSLCGLCSTSSCIHAYFCISVGYIYIMCCEMVPQQWLNNVCLDHESYDAVWHLLLLYSGCMLCMTSRSKATSNKYNCFHLLYPCAAMCVGSVSLTIAQVLTGCSKAVLLMSETVHLHL